MGTSTASTQPSRRMHCVSSSLQEPPNKFLNEAKAGTSAAAAGTDACALNSLGLQFEELRPNKL
eukprot:911569-Amphidinium_carterae.1